MMTANICLACQYCDRGDMKNITPQQLQQCKAERWTDTPEVQSFEE